MCEIKMTVKLNYRRLNILETVRHTNLHNDETKLIFSTAKRTISNFTQQQFRRVTIAITTDIFGLFPGPVYEMLSKT